MFLQKKTRNELIEEIKKLQSKISATTETEDRFHKLSEAAFEAIVIHENGKILDVNEATVRMFGYSRKELLQLYAFDLAVKEDRQLLKQQVARKYEKPYEARGLKKDGTTFPGELNAREFIYKDRTARVVAIRDITERKKSDRLLKQAKEDYENLINQSPDGIFILDEKGKIIFSNPGAHQILGIKTHVLKGQSPFNYILPKYNDRIKGRFWQAANGRSVPFMKIEALKADGTIINIEYKPVGINYRDKKAMLIVFHDVSVQEQLEKEKTRTKHTEKINHRLKVEIEERKKVEIKLNAIIESSSHIVWTVDKNNALLTFNKNCLALMRRIFGNVKFMDADGSKNNFSFNKSEDSFWNKKYKNAFQGIPQHFETCFIDTKGNEIWFEIYLNPILDSNKRVKEVSGIGHDITEKKSSEQQIVQSLKEKEVLLKEVHHRVKNNLQVISSLLNLQSSYVSDNKVTELLKESQNRIKSMSFIHESLYQSKDFSNIKFAEYIKHLTNNLILSYKPKEKKILLEQKLQNAHLNLDFAIPCGLIVNELVSNALKYAFTTKQNGKISISFKRDKKQNIELIIADDGTGLPKEVDFRNTQSLGLQLVMVLVSQLRGEITLNNKKGATFVITFNEQNLN